MKENIQPHPKWHISSQSCTQHDPVSVWWIDVMWLGEMPPTIAQLLFIVEVRASAQTLSVQMTDGMFSPQGDSRSWPHSCSQLSTDATLLTQSIENVAPKKWSESCLQSRVTHPLSIVWLSKRLAFMAAISRWTHDGGQLLLLVKWDGSVTASCSAAAWKCHKNLSGNVWWS